MSYARNRLIIVIILFFALILSAVKEKKLQLPVKWTFQGKASMEKKDEKENIPELPKDLKIEIKYPPAVDEEAAIIYAASDKYIFKIDAITGSLKDYKMLDYAFKYNPLLSEKKLYVLLDENRVGCISAELKEPPLWNVEVEKAELNAILLTDEGLVASSSKGLLVAISNEGNLLWRVELEGGIKFQPSYGGEEPHIYCTDNESNLYKISESDGKVIWKAKLPAQATGKPVPFRERIYFGIEGGHFIAVDSDDGEVDWSFHTVNNNVAPAVGFDGMICFGSLNNQLYCRNHRSGSLDVRMRSSKRFYKAPVIAGRLLFAAPFGDEFLIIDIEEERAVGKTDYKKKITAPLRACDSAKVIIVVTDEGKLEALDYGGILKMISEEYAEEEEKQAETEENESGEEGLGSKSEPAVKEDKAEDKDSVIAEQWTLLKLLLVFTVILR